ncbi:hypothetical protein HYS72_00580 [Candidatus Pacearchaeota archaeon]|nr:hypothetical protein [Candidatus Pacearchaeota archaeon]
MKRGLKKLSILVILAGFFFILNSSFAVITGNVVSKRIDVLDSFLGIMFLVGGLALFLVGELELKTISVYDASKGKVPKKKEKFYHMTDPLLYFSKVGDVSLEEFKRGIKEIENDRELMRLVKEEYGPQLLEKESKGKLLERNIAEEFLKVLYSGKIPRQEKELITKKEIYEIRRAFDPGWYGKPDAHQSKILKEHGFAYAPKPGHGEIYSKNNPNIRILASSTPSDVNAGKNVARQIVSLLKKSG